MPSLAVIPGESEEADQVVGSFFGEDIQTNPTIGTLTTVGSFFSTTHHVVVYSNNSMFCSTLGYAVMWALIVGRRLLEAQGLREMRIIRGPTDIAKEVSAPDAGTDNVFRTSVHLVHKWPLTYTDLEEGQLIDEVRVITNDFGNPGNNNAF